MTGEYDEQVCMYQRIHMFLVNSEILSAIWSGGKFQFKSFNFWIPEILQGRDFKTYGIKTKQLCFNKELPWWKHVHFLPVFLRWESHNIKYIIFKRKIRGIYYIPNAVKTPPLLLSKHFYHPKMKPCTFDGITYWKFWSSNTWDRLKAHGNSIYDEAGISETVGEKYYFTNDNK